MTMVRSYSELSRLKTFEERYKYLKLNGKVGDLKFSGNRYWNQRFYRSPEWKRVRNEVIIRDHACDLGIDGRELSKIYIHHINPISLEDLKRGSSLLFDPDNLICVSHMTHEAIHYGDESLLFIKYTPRKPGDTCPWK